jgi:hypothetical protein
MGDCLLWAVFENCKSSLHIFFGLLFPTFKVMYFFRQKCIGLRFGRKFIQTHLVTLPGTYNYLNIFVEKIDIFDQTTTKLCKGWRIALGFHQKDFLPNYF